MSDHERDKWNERYRKTGIVLHEPARWLTQWNEQLPTRGRALDIAGGSGRNAIWLARRGLQVTLVDIAAVGVALAAENAQAAGVLLNMIVADLESGPLPAGPWDVIINFYFLLRSLWPQLSPSLAPGGYLAFAHQTRRNLERHTHPPAHLLLDEGELLRFLRRIPEMEILDYREEWNTDGHHEAKLLARRRF